ncbi:MAG: hypoxanthine phosphoribosyltransferase [Lentisphaeria bacterium]|nr:hypoxanthine phosphoribosyltransferase [Lentisphaeria bacterium]
MIRTLFSKEEIARKVEELGRKISRDYEGKTLTVIALLNGGLPFTADLIRHISIPVFLDSFAASSYVDDRSSKKLTVRSRLKEPVEGRHILLVDDILDTGHSLAATVEYFRKMAPASIKTCVFLDKKLDAPKPVSADYTGYEVENVYVVGYGLDSHELYRNLPFVGVVEND